MMNKDTGKKLAMFLGALFVAAIFLSSYLSSSNSSGSTTSTKPSTAYLATGTAKATVTGYGSDAFFKLANQSNSTAANVSSLLSRLEENGSISNYYHTTEGYQVALSSMNAYALQQSVRNITTQAYSNVTVTTYLLMPANVELYVNNYPLTVPLSRRNYSISLTGVRPVGSYLNVSVLAFVTANGSVYNNQLRINYT
jgi:hypothetical protein